MIRKVFFWLHLSLGVVAGLFIFIMAATGVLLSFERQINDFADRDIRTVSVPGESQARPLNDLLQTVRHSGVGDPTAIVLHKGAQSSAQFLVGRGKSVYVDPYSAAVLGASSVRTHEFFSLVERWHRTLGSSLGSRSAGHWLMSVSNLLFGCLIVLGVFLWIPRQWSRNALRASLAFRRGLRGKARDWSWHNVLGIWCALPLLVIALTGVVMSFDWANTLLFRMSGSPPPAARRPPADNSRGDGRHELPAGSEPNYSFLFAAAQKLNAEWRTITLNIARDEKAPISVTVDTGTGGQPQKRAQFLLDRQTGATVKATAFGDGSLGQRWRAFVRFGHTGEYGGWPGQLIAAIASLAACLLVYTGLALALRRLAAVIRRRERYVSPAGARPHREKQAIT